MALTVLHVIDSGGFFGAESVLVELVDEQRRLGINAIVCSIGQPGEGEKPLERVLKARGLPFWSERMRAGLNVSGAIRILRRAKASHVNVLHSHGYKANILFGLMPRVFRRLTMVTTLHGWTYMGGVNKMAIYTLLDVVALHFMDGVAIVSEGMRERRELKVWPLKNLRVIENGIPVSVPSVEDDAVSGRLRLLRSKGPVIGTVGRLSKEKGFEILLAAFASLKTQFPDVQLVLLGDGPCRRELELLAEELGVRESVCFVGYVDNAGKYISLFSLYVNSSYTEGMPITLLEAMRARCPIVASKVGGIPQVIDDEVGGLLCSSGDAELLAQKIAMTLRSDNVRPMTEHSYQKFQSRFSIATTANGYMDFYRDSMNFHEKQAVDLNQKS